jgi:hypothetical protein
MAKGNTGAEDHAKVKVRVIEFELEGGNATVENSIRQLTTALTSRNSPPKNIVAPPKNNKELPVGTPEPEEEVVDAEVMEPEAVEANANGASAPAKPPRQKKPKPPTYLHDLITDTTGFKEFAKEKAPDGKTKQYLAAAYWLQEFGNCPSVNADKVYTCYKTAEWSVGFNDWAQTFHNLVFSEQMRKVGKGEFAINPTGEEVVKAMKKDTV